MGPYAIRQATPGESGGRWSRLDAIGSCAASGGIAAACTAPYGHPGRVVGRGVNGALRSAIRRRRACQGHLGPVGGHGRRRRGFRQRQTLRRVGAGPLHRLPQRRRRSNGRTFGPEE
eukprot:scaffold11428_cov105-Isochrysis_galbana.AAC.4